MIPAVVLTGFLGAGKTTALNALIAARPDLRIGVIENEAGEASVDRDLLHGAARVIDVTGGCACCTVRGALTAALELPQATIRLPQASTEQDGAHHGFTAHALRAHAALDPVALERWLDLLFADPAVARVKGVVTIAGRGRRQAINATPHHRQTTTAPGEGGRAGRLS